MIIKSNELKQYITGAVYFEEENGGIIPYRFTKEKIYTPRDTENKIRLTSPAGIKIDFYSDTESISFKYTAYMEIVSQLYRIYGFDIYSDGDLVLHRCEKDVNCDRSGEISVKLKEGTKRITVYLPNSCGVKIEDFNIDDGSFIKKADYGKNAYFFGDSITHAAYLDFTSKSYANIISQRYNYCAVNQAIGGDIFDKDHLLYLPDFKPDVIYVAYGTNDWRWANDTCGERICEYFCMLNEHFKDVETNVILPIWRKDLNDCPDLKYSFNDVRNIIKNEAQKYGYNVFDGFNFVPHIEKLFFDEYLHPNEMGFAFYADALQTEINKLK